MQRVSLTYEQRLLAVQRISAIHMAAGLYDRAEDMFNQLTDETEFRRRRYSLANLSANQRLAKGDRSSRNAGKPSKDKQRIEIAHFTVSCRYSRCKQRRHGIARWRC